jgi:hypothetical protein
MNLTKKSNVGPLSDGRRSDNDRQSGIDIRSKKENRWQGDRRSSTSDRVWAGTGDRNFVTNLKSTSSDFSFCAQNQVIKHRLKSASALVSPEPKKTIFARSCPVALASTSAPLLKNFDTRGDLRLRLTRLAWHRTKRLAEEYNSFAVFSCNMPARVRTTFSFP